jgi:hypothetical protein
MRAWPIDCRPRLIRAAFVLVVHDQPEKVRVERLRVKEGLERYRREARIAHPPTRSFGISIGCKRGAKREQISTQSSFNWQDSKHR